MNISIIKLTPNDWQQYKDIRLECLKEEPQAFNSTFEECMKYPDIYWKQKLENPQDIYAFAKSEDSIVGLMNITIGEKDEPTDVATLHGAFVKKDFRGVGIGRLLLDFLLDEIKNNKEIKVVKLWVKESQTAAINLYKSVGFELKEKVGTRTLIFEKSLK